MHISLYIWIVYPMCPILSGVRGIVYVFIPCLYHLHLFMMHGLSSSARLVFGKPAFGMLPFLMRRLGCLCPLSASRLLSCIFAWIRFVSLGLRWGSPGLRCIHLTIHYHCSLLDAWLMLGCSACICKACLRQAFPRKVMC